MNPNSEKSEWLKGYDAGKSFGYKQGYTTGFEAGRKSAGTPHLAANQCPGGGGEPKDGLVKLKSTGHPGRGCCTVCGVEFKLTWKGYVRRHRRKAP